ncbi:hypothetical protein Fleli_1036 [Bernardetia litoralis DSM 6794]|uniref:DUF3885 domain-containing protein n=1 Tax=Bernardetia litoralis (strain ATCC 23117 / DSM 6794 / NBRC 15988 / NCIMB 1366 / Fx l1 / Sio-4) TaxID=880071 RepID=I4AHP6_BERLS|nr:DUF3885 domain-containing protein [Bernardetia litoralis]AFM03481.1 hypothetical protein Fleli_1036 [Bernardetia litoralis DSM 6794]
MTKLSILQSITVKKRLRTDLQTFLTHLNSNSQIEDRQTIGAKINIRFELGDKLKNGTIKRVNQATQRALRLFNDVFEDIKTPIWILIYENQQSDIYSSKKEYLYQQFEKESFINFYNKIENLHSGYFNTDKNGNEIEEMFETRVIIGKIPISKINIKNILCGIANYEMGFEPAIGQSIFFFNPKNDTSFYMYDDRGCVIRSKKADTIKSIYHKRNNWIVDYHRATIDTFFQ